MAFHGPSPITSLPDAFHPIFSWHFLSLRRGWSYFLFCFCFWASGSGCVEQTGTLAAITLFPPPGCLNYRCLPPCPDWYWMVVKMFPCKHGKFGVLVPPWAYTSIFLFSTGRTMYSLWVTGKDKIILSLSPIKEASSPWRHSRSRAEESKTGLDCLTVLENKEVLKHL